MPWIHLQHLVRVIASALTDDRYEGTTVLRRTKALGRALHRPAVLPVPALALKLIFGAAAGVLLSSQRVKPQRLRELGFTYRVGPHFQHALTRHVLATQDILQEWHYVVRILETAHPPDSIFAAQRAPTKLRKLY